ncbi:MAG: NAD-dependent epimerase/dehydratase family protein [candidate division Zixibacteria bacterium]|nr:NAD-dependent epimerase/dehydratase family protein [candidate division Zixibacteria bacterium]
MEGSRILITGGAGLIGSHIADLLVQKDTKEIIILDNFTRGTEDNLNWASNVGNVTIIEGDIRDPEMLLEATRNVDYVFHQAAPRITACAEYPRGAMDIMVNGTFNVLDAAVRNNVKKVVAASSASVYGMAEQFPTNESHHPYDNETIYGTFKLSNEGMMRSFHAMYGLDYTPLRYFNVYGPRMDVFGVYTEVMIRWLDAIDEWVPPQIHGDGSATMDFVYVGDVARANVMAMETPNARTAINIGTGIETSLSELLELMLELTSSNLQPEYAPLRKVNPVKRRLADVSLAKNLLGFEAKSSLREGLSQLIEWRKEMKEFKQRLVLK